MSSCFKSVTVCLLGLLLSGVGLAGGDSRATAEVYDVVLAGGRVIDPETGLDAIRHVGIRAGQIAEVSDTVLQGKDVVDVKGLVVAPGFIDLHSHGAFSLSNQHYQLHDGVTTALELEAGTINIVGAADRVKQRALINYGASAGYLDARLLTLDGLIRPGIEGERKGDFVGLKGFISALKYKVTGENRATIDQASGTEIDSVIDVVDQERQKGALGIGLLLDYMSAGVNQQEVKRIFEYAAQHHQVVFVHQRRSMVMGDPSGLHELIDLAETTGTSVHLCHITSAAINNIDTFLRIISEAQGRGVDITTEAYPYTAGSTSLNAQVFQRDWQAAFGIDYEDIEYPKTGERLTKERFEQLQREDPEAIIVHHYKKEEWIKPAITSPLVIIASDAMLRKGIDDPVHPRSSGTFSRVLGHYVRELGVLSLQDAIKKMTLMPAQRMESMSSAFKHKGRLQPEMDADITVFDPVLIEDQATYQNTNQHSKGIHHVLVNGQFALRDSHIVNGKASGQWIQSGQ